MTYRPRRLAVVATALAALGGASTLAVAGVSPPGASWTSRASAADNQWQAVTYGAGVFVAVARSGAGNRVMTSPDGVNWTLRQSAGDLSWRSVAYGGGRFVAVADDGLRNSVMTSPDGVTWTRRAAASDRQWTSVAYGGGRFVAVARNGAGGNGVMTSTDGITWTTGQAAGDRNWTSVTYGADKFVAVAYNAPPGEGVMVSLNGTTWVGGPAATGYPWADVAYGNGRFVAISLGGCGVFCVMSSTSGLGWSGVPTPTPTWEAITYGGGTFVAVTPIGTERVMRSTTGTSGWDARTAAAQNQWRDVTYANGMFVAVASTGTGDRVMTSGTFTPDAAPAAGAGGTTPGATPATVGACADTFYQQANRTIRWNAKRKAYRVVSRIRVFEDAPAVCRTKLSVIYRSSKTKVSLAQKSGSTLGYRKLKGNFNAPVISWPTTKEMRFTTGDTTGQNRKNARLVLVSYLKKARNMPKLNDIEMVIVRRIPRDPRAATSSANPLYGQKSTFGRTRAWAGVQ